MERIETGPDGFHERKGVARRAPGVEGGESGGAVEEDKRALPLFEAASKAAQRAVQIVSRAF